MKIFSEELVEKAAKACQVADLSRATIGEVLLVAQFHHILAAYIGNIGSGNRSVPGHIGASDGDGSAQRSNHFHGVLVVVGKNGAGNNGIVPQLLVKEGSHGAVDDTAVQDTPVGGLALAAVERAGDAAYGVHSLFKLDGQREVVNAGLGNGVAGAGGQNHGVTVTADTFCIGKLCYLTGLYGKGAAADFHLENLVVGELFTSNH